jgi:hypothetical protein
MGVRPLAEPRRVGDEPAVPAPHMELITGRFVHEPQRRLSGEVKAKLGAEQFLANPGDSSRDCPGEDGDDTAPTTPAATPRGCDSAHHSLRLARC